MIIVFAVGMSMPDSMIVVATRTSASPAHEREHHVLELARRHLPVPDDDPRVGRELLDVVGDGLDVVHAVVHEVDLPLAGELALDRALDAALRLYGITSVTIARRSSGGVVSSRCRGAPASTCAACAGSAWR
jgi:hypothetical protein